MHLARASTVEAQTTEEAKSLSKTESCDRKPVIDLQMPASRNLAVGSAKMRHTYTLVWRSTATFISRRVCYARLLTSTIFIRVQFVVPFRIPVLVEAGQD